jgi:AmmeMemoRadiSam system protein B
MPRIRYLSTLLVAVCVSYTCAAPPDQVREAAVAGQFYPGSPAELSRAVSAYLADVPPASLPGDIVAVLVPHAGYPYSAPVAAHAYKALSERKIDTIVLVGNSHHFELSRAAVYPRGKFRTPLGTAEIDERLARRITGSSPLFEENTAPHGPEHSLEVQLPFIQVALPRAKIVPILFGRLTREQCRAAGEAIARSIRAEGPSRRIAIVASSDLSHYPSQANAAMVDHASIAAIEKLAPEALADTSDRLLSTGTVPRLACTACGMESLTAALYAARDLGADRATLLKYANSGDVTAEHSRVVGYAAMACTKPSSVQRGAC